MITEVSKLVGKHTYKLLYKESVSKRRGPRQNRCVLCKRRGATCDPSSHMSIAVNYVGICYRRHQVTCS